MANVKKILDLPAAEEVQATIEHTAAEAAVPLKAMQESVRTLTEKSLEQARSQYASARKTAEEATATLESSFNALTQGIIAFNTQALEALRSNANATFDHLARLQGVKSVAEAVELNAAHVRQQMDSLGAQTKALQSLAQKAANDVAQPVKSAMTARR